MSTIAVIGATGYAGGHIASEALSRGHNVIGVSRSSPSSPPAGLVVRTGTVTDELLIDELASQVSTLVVAVHGVVDGKPFLPTLIPSLLAVTGRHGVRLGIVGGAGSLVIAPGGPRLLDTAEFPEMFKAEAEASAAALELLRTSDSSADWFYVSPAAGFGSYAPGLRIGHFRTGADVLLTDAEGNSAISGADYAIAFVDEIEHPTHHRERFTVAY